MTATSAAMGGERRLGAFPGGPDVLPPVDANDGRAIVLGPDGYTDPSSGLVADTTGQEAVHTSSVTGNPEQHSSYWTGGLPPAEPRGAETVVFDAPRHTSARGLLRGAMSRLTGGRLGGRGSSRQPVATFLGDLDPSKTQFRFADLRPTDKVEAREVGLVDYDRPYGNHLKPLHPDLHKRPDVGAILDPYAAKGILWRSRAPRRLLNSVVALGGGSVAGYLAAEHSFGIVASGGTGGFWAGLVDGGITAVTLGASMAFGQWVHRMSEQLTPGWQKFVRIAAGVGSTALVGVVGSILGSPIVGGVLAAEFGTGFALGDWAQNSGYRAQVKAYAKNYAFAMPAGWRREFVEKKLEEHGRTPKPPKSKNKGQPAIPQQKGANGGDGGRIQMLDADGDGAQSVTV